MSKAYPELSPIIIPYRSHGVSNRKKAEQICNKYKIFFNQKIQLSTFFCKSLYSTEKITCSV